MLSGKSQKSLTATGTIAALFLAILLAAILTTPASATTTSQLTASRIPTMEEIQQGRMDTGYLDLKFADGLNFLTNWTITPKNLKMIFNLHIAHIIEFIDNNTNGIFDSGDEIQRDIKLSDLTWRLSKLVTAKDNVTVTFTGSNNYLVLSVCIYVYFKDTNITGPGYSGLVPGFRAVKVDIVINNYQWMNSNSKLALVIVLKCQQVEAEYEYRYRLTNGTTFGNNDRTSGFVPSFDGDESEIGLVMAGNEHEVKARWRWFNYALNSSDSQQTTIPVVSYFNVTDEGVELQLCVEHFGNNEVSFDPYFEVLSVEEGLPVEMLPLLQYYVVGQASNQVFFVALAGAAALLIVGVTVAVYLKRR